jgi:uncharacterized membrane protein YsdA (DUF1294 family)/cold shock CspA family protein
MRKIGIIQKWNDEKGFGFIESGPNNDEYFFHINSFRNREQRPFVGLEVNFEFGEDKNGRTQAIKVRTIGKESQPSAAGAFITSSFFLILVGVICLIGFLPKAVWWFYIGASVWAFLLYYLDKSAAKKGKRRTPEASLHNIALIGGWPGALFAQQQLRHKSKKESFRRTFWVTVFINVAALIYLASPYGAWLVHEINQFFG